MEERSLIYFVSDVHLGLNVADPADRETRFVDFLRSIPGGQTRALYMLGDIWDFWYEYHDVVPKGNVRVFSALMDLIEAGVEVYFLPGNHDMWCYSYLQSMGIRVIDQPYFFEAGGKRFCVGHGDGLGPGMKGYKLMKSVFRNKVAQALFSTLHPRVAFAIARKWSGDGRLSRKGKYVFRGEEEPLYRYAAGVASQKDVDFFVFGHYHAAYDSVLPGGGRLMLMSDWIDSSDYLYFNGISVCFGHSRKTE